MRDFVLEKQIVTHVMLLSGIISSELHLCPKQWYSVVGRSFLKANKVLPF